MTDFVCKAKSAFFLWIWRVKKDNKRFWRLYRQLQILIIWPFFLFMIFQNLLYGLFISKLKEQSFLLDLFFSLELKLGF